MDPAGHVWTIATRIEETTEEVRSGRWSKILEEKLGAAKSGWR
jgi:PhnB protein